jgi:hypothetical protein
MAEGIKSSLGADSAAPVSELLDLSCNVPSFLSSTINPNKLIKAAYMWVGY